MMRPAIGGALFSIVCCCIVFADDDELLRDPSFETDDENDGWTVTERTSLWTSTRRAIDASSEYVRFSDAVSHSGQRSLSLGPWRGASETAVFVSQYRDLASSTVSAPLALSFWSRGLQSERLKVCLDISYADNRFMFVEVKPTSEDPSGFVSTCTFIPNYGKIRSIMLHLLIDVSLDETIYVDDVSLRLLDSPLPSECHLYTSSFPVERHVMSRFLSPPSNTNDGHRVTMATQLTEDRLIIVEQTAAIWRGPISAALLIYGPPSSAQMSALTTRYYSSEALQSFVTLHVIWEDQGNGKDGKMYPANALRNLAIAHSTTEFVFYVDADMFPGFSESQASQWLTTASVGAAKALSGCEKCAFVVPLFNWASKTTSGYPQTKEELRVRVRDPSSGIKSCQLLSHSAVDYNKWFSSSETHRTNFVDDMEPYFIVRSTAPVMHDIYTGYGWDKCAYSRDLKAAGFEFYVLPEAFLVNLLDASSSDNTIMVRARGIPVRLFLNSAFHRNDLLHGHIRHPTTYRSKSYDHERIDETMNTPTKRPDTPAVKETANSAAPLPSFEPLDPDGGMGCNTVRLDMKFSLIPELVIASRDSYVPQNRKDILIERLMKVYGVYTFIEIPALTTLGSLRFMLPLVHPDALVSLQPDSTSDEYIAKGVFHSYRSKGNVTEGLNRIVAKHLDPKLFSVNIDKLSELKAMEFVIACLKQATDEDILLIDDGVGSKSDSFWNHLFSDMCLIHTNWKTYRKDRFVIMKSELLRKAAPLALPPLPDCVQHFKPRSDVTTDIVLFSKNRPLQTFAFMDSLKRQVTGLNKVWILLKTEGEIFDRGYEMIIDCFSSFVPIEVIRQSSSTSFGAQILKIIEASSADSVMFAVDEIIWLRPVNLSVVSSLLHDCDHTLTSTFQLRLGENIRCLNMFDDHSSRFHPLAFDADVSAYYPRRLPYDFGYVLNVDGVVARREELVGDLRDFVGTCTTPACLEQGWITHRLHDRSRQWHFTYKHSRMVNNMGMSDGRVADQRGGPAEGSFQLARILVEERKRIDVESFGRRNRDHANTHQSSPVDFVDLDFC